MLDRDDPIGFEFHGWQDDRSCQAPGTRPRAFRFAMDEAGALFPGTLIPVITAGFGMYHLEHDVQPEVFATVYDSLWWAVVTLTTVGHGDIQPVTAGGRILATVAMCAGIGVIGSACGIMADALWEASAGEQAA